MFLLHYSHSMRLAGNKTEKRRVTLRDAMRRRQAFHFDHRHRREREQQNHEPVLRGRGGHSEYRLQHRQREHRELQQCRDCDGAQQVRVREQSQLRQRIALAAAGKGERELREGHHGEGHHASVIEIRRIPLIGPPETGGCHHCRYEAVEHDHRAADQVMTGFARPARSAHDVGLRRLHRQGQGRQAVGHQVDPQNLDRPRAARPARQGGEEHEQDLARVGGQQVGMNFWMLSKMPRPSSTALTMEAKLSSVSTMSEASLVTSVPVMPMAMPMSAALTAGASLTPSPVMATTWPRCLQALHHAQLVLGRDAGDRRRC